MPGFDLLDIVGGPVKVVGVVHGGAQRHGNKEGEVFTLLLSTCARRSHQHPT